jgi:hypothetical protein
MRCATHAHPAATDMGRAAHPHSTTAAEVCATAATEVCAAASAKVCAAASDSYRGRIRGAGENGKSGDDGEESDF